MTLDLKSIIPIVSAAIIFGGFYYTTQHRLDSLEEEIQELRKDLSKTKKQINRQK